MCVPQTHWGLGIGSSLFSFLELGLLTRVGLHVLAGVALPGSGPLLLHAPCLGAWSGGTKHGSGEGPRKQAFQGGVDTVLQSHS